MLQQQAVEDTVLDSGAVVCCVCRARRLPDCHVDGAVARACLYVAVTQV